MPDFVKEEHLYDITITSSWILYTAVISTPSVCVLGIAISLRFVTELFSMYLFWIAKCDLLHWIIILDYKMDAYDFCLLYCLIKALKGRTCEILSDLIL